MTNRQAVRRTTRRIPASLVASLVIAAVIMAGCANAPAARGSGGNTNAARMQAVQFAQCMRQNGVPEFPDPGPSGALTIDAIANGSSIDTSSPAFQRAVSACRALEPAGFTGGQRNPEQQAAALKFAQCIREHGVKDFPDPAPGAPLVDTNLIPSTATTSGLSILKAAMQTCSHLAAAAGAQR